MKMLIVHLGLILSLFSCAGYQVKKEENPFKIYGVEALAVPMFINRSAFPLIAGQMTQEIRLMLNQFPGLELFSGEGGEGADAVLVGIIDSPKNLRDAMKTTGTTFVSGDLKESIGDRPAFYLPTQAQLRVDVTFVLIKRPSQEDLELLESEMAPYLINHPKILFKEVMNLNRSFSRAIESNLGPDDGGIVNATRNKKLVELEMKNMAESAALQFKRVVLNAF